MQIFLVFAGAALLMLSFVISLTIIAKVVNGVQKSASETVVETVTSAMKQIFGGAEPAEQLPGNTEVAEPQIPWFPDHELDDLAFPGSVEEIRGMEAGWAPSSTTTPPLEPPN